MPHYELELEHPGPVCGVDEAGRGPWAGPVSAAAVILDPARIPVGLNDSKKLSAKARNVLEIEIKEVAIAWGVAFGSVEEIAELNILRATGLAMRRAVEALAIPAAFALVDGNYRFDLPCPIRTVVKGDTISGTAGEAQQVFDRLEDVGIDLRDVFLVLEDEGVEKFEKSWQELLDATQGQLDDKSK